MREIAELCHLKEFIFLHFTRLYPLIHSLLRLVEDAVLLLVAEFLSELDVKKRVSILQLELDSVP